VITTGGRSRINPAKGDRWRIYKAEIETYLGPLRLPDTQIDTKRLMNTDSLEMTDADRAQVLEAVRERPGMRRS